MYDVFFLSYDEESAPRNFERLKSIHPRPKRVEGVKGIQAAHIECARRARTKFFFVVDADNRITDPEVFSYKVPKWDEDYVHLWYARNPVNGLEYGWGGLKLFPKKVFRGLDEMKLDMTTSFELKVIPQRVSVTAFDTSPFETWRSAFRECAKLAMSSDPKARERLATWKGVAEGEFADWALWGAAEGETFARQHPEDIQSINDYAWLKERFQSR
jgi:hypothetical protein